MTARIALLVLLCTAAALGAAAPAFGAADGAAVVVAQEPPPADGPAVTLPVAEDEDEADDPWTTRYLIPTGLAISAVVILLVALAWGWKRSRYRVVE